MSLRKAINDKCKECIYDGACGYGTWRQQVEACTSPNCPLYPVRPRPAHKDRRFDGVTASFAGQNGRTT